jgi:hypothetical protein
MNALRPRSSRFPSILVAVALLAPLGTARPAAATHCDSCVVAVDTCCTQLPRIMHPADPYVAPAGLVETRAPSFPAGFVVTLYDLTQNIPVENNNWNPITRYHGPGGNWTVNNLGSVFGVTFDRHANIYVTHTSCYSNDFLPSGGSPGSIYRIDGTNGSISLFATLPNFADPSVSAGSNLPGLGNISYDCDHDQFFVTNLEDGKIYRLKSFNALNASPATLLNAFDPGTPDPGVTSPGWAPLTERLWGVQWHANRVYYSVWATDFGSPPNANTIRSVGLDASGDFVWWNDQQEIVVPSFPGAGGRSAPVSDISFGPTGRMLLGERGMGNLANPADSPTSPSPHRARVLEYYCDTPAGGTGGQWVTGYNFAIGQINTQTNASGGVDYDFAPYDGPVGGPGLGGSQGRVWATADAIHLTIPYPDQIYGLQGLRPTGGSILNSLLIDSDGNVFGQDKTEIGDVEIPCPPHKAGEIQGMKFRDLDHDGVMDLGEPGLAGWTINITGPVNTSTVTSATGDYSFTGLPSGKYLVSEVTQPNWIQTMPSPGPYSIPVYGGVVSNVNFGNYACPPAGGGAAGGCVTPPTGMVAWWPLDEPVGNLAHDIIGPNPGAWQSGPTVVAGKVGNALSFPTASQYVAVNNHASLNFGTGDFSIDCWVRSTNTDPGVRTIVDHRSGTSSNPVGYVLFMSGNRLAFQLGDGGPTTNWVAPGTSQTLTDGQWHHVAVTVIRNQISGGTLWVDATNVLTFNPTVRPNSVSNTGQLWIGQRMIVSPTDFAGEIDEVEIFKRALNVNEITAIYNAGSNGKCKKYCYVPKAAIYWDNQQSVTVCFNVCNKDWSAPATFNWTLAGLPIGAGCTVAGPTVFTPPTGTVTVPPGGCVPVCVAIQRPPGLVPGQTACYQLTVMDTTKGTCFSCTGKLTAGLTFKLQNPVASDLQVIPANGSTPVCFEVTNNGGVPADFAYEIRGESSDEDPANRAISLNGLPPGVPVIDTRMIASGATEQICVDVSYDSYLGIPPGELFLHHDSDNDGIREPIAAIGTTPELLTLVGVTPEPEVARVDRATIYPNPFDASTGVGFALAKQQFVMVRVYDVNGRLLKVLQAGPMTAGRHYVVWDGSDSAGHRVGAGMYFMRVVAGERTLESKVVRVK